MATSLKNAAVVAGIRQRMAARQVRTEETPQVTMTRVVVEVVSTKARPVIEAPVRPGTEPSVVDAKFVYRPRVTVAMLHAMEHTKSGPYRLCTGTSTGHRGR